jgi:hypothetical protein
MDITWTIWSNFSPQRSPYSNMAGKSPNASVLLPNHHWLYIIIAIWMFLKMGIPPNQSKSSILCSDFPWNKPSGYPHFWKPQYTKKRFKKKVVSVGGYPPPPNPQWKTPPSLPERSVCRLPAFKRRRAWRIHGKIMGGMVFQQKVPLELMLLNVTYI